jgi:hypothetical protein
MIRLSTCVSVMLACGSGLYLYQTKHQAQVLDRQIEHTVKTITQTRMQTRELSASWTLLGSPDRLQQLSDQFLGIKSVLPGQFVAMSDLDLRLPAARTLDAPSSGAPSSGAPDDTGSDTTPIATTEPTAAPDTPTTPAPISPAAMPAATSRAVAAAASPAPHPSAPYPSAPSPNLPADATRAPAVAATAPSAGSATDPAKGQAAATTHPADRKPGDMPHPGHDAGHDPGHDVAQTHPAAPRPAGPSPIVAELERPVQPAYQRFAPAPASGSMLGMAHVVVRAPVPLPVSTAPAVETGH